MVASGKMPATPLASVQAYVDHANFGALPRPGGIFDQPAQLLDEMRYVASVVNRARKRLADREAEALKRATRRR